MFIEKYENLSSRIRSNQINESSGRFISPDNPLDVTLRALDLNILYQCHKFHSTMEIYFCVDVEIKNGKLMEVN